MESTNTRLRKLVLGVEKIGNKLPHPFWIFVNSSILMVLLSFILSGNSFKYFNDGKLSVVKINNLLQINYLLNLVRDLPETFAHFKPFPIVILILMGVSVFQESGAISALIRATLKKTPTKYLIAVVALIGVNSNIASDAAVIIVPAISGALFQSLGLHPWLGIIVGYATANGGFTLNMFIAGTDVILSGITASVAENIGITSNIHTFSNWYFMVAASVLVVFLTVLVSERITRKILNQKEKKLESFIIDEVGSLSINEKKGLKCLLYSNIAYFLILISIGKYYLSKNLLSLSTLEFFF